MERLTFLLGLVPLLVATSAQGQSDPSVAWIVDGYSVANFSSQAPPSNVSPEAPRSTVSPQTPLSTVSTPTPFSTVSMEAPCCDDVVPIPQPYVGIGHRMRAYGGYEFGWLQPRFTENVGVVATRPTGQRVYPYEQPFEITPRVWVGIENSRCTGIRARYWNIDTYSPRQVLFASAFVNPLSLTIEGASGNLSRTAVAVGTDAMTLDHHLEMRTIDFEGTQRVRYSRTEVLGSFGLRYAKTHQRAHAVATDGTTGLLTELVCQDVDFEGFGPTTSFELKRALFGTDSMFRGLSFFADGRGSILFGEQQQEIVLVTGGGATLAEDYYVHDNLLPIAELIGGLQLQAQPFGCGLWTIRTGYRAESWFGLGGPTDTVSNVGLHGVILSLAAAW